MAYQPLRVRALFFLKVRVFKKIIFYVLSAPESEGVVLSKRRDMCKQSCGLPTLESEGSVLSKSQGI
jgi:hypothetical protein